ncbi:MAG: hypothetical protein JHC95_11220 [Solirubrobacteraceae bacterium]|nr:hypothetical protein [Solirubrobacteraceae bacterium]
MQLRNSPGLLAASAVAAVLFAGCGNQGDLGATCEEFLKAEDQKQMEIAAQWANPAKDGSMTDESKFMALGVRASLLRYCGQDGHGDDEIGNLRVSGAGP